MNPILHALGWTLLHFLWEGLLIGLLAWGALALLQRRSPEARYAAGLCFLGLMAASPVLTFLFLMPAAHAPAVAAMAGPASPLPWTLRFKLWLDPDLPAVLALWIAGVGLLSARFAGSLVYLQRLTSVGVEPAPSEWHLVVARLCREMGLRRAVRLLRSFRVEAPMVVGWIRPVILVPAAAFAGLSPAQVEAVLAHEMAHIRRHDFLVNLAQSVLETLLFFHPAVWWLSSRLRAERELCCDDTAVAFCGDRAAYARALATLEGLRQPAPADLRVGADGGSLMARIRRLLQPQLAPNPRFRSAALALAAAGLLAGTAIQQPKASAAPHQAHSWHLDREGEVTLDPQAEEPVKVGKNGNFKLKETVGGLTRSYEATDKGGVVYKVNGVPTPMDDAARAWLKASVARTQRDEAMGRAKNRMRAEQARLAAEQARMEADQDRAEAERIRIEEMPEVATETKDGKQHIIVRKQGKVVSDSEIPDPPEVSMTEEGPGRQHLVIKKDGKVVEDKVIEVPEVTTDEKNGKLHIVVKKGGKVTEDRVVELPKDGDFAFDGGPGARAWAWKEESSKDGRHEKRFRVMRGGPEGEAEALRQEIRELQERLDTLEKGAGAPPPPPPPPPPAK